MLVIVSSKCSAIPMAVNLDQMVAFAPVEHAVVAEKPSGKRIELGLYATPERAVEVFNALLAKHMDFFGEGLAAGSKCSHPWAFTPPKKFIMPEE